MGKRGGSQGAWTMSALHDYCMIRETTTAFSTDER